MGAPRSRAALGPVGKDPRFARQEGTTGPGAALLLELAQRGLRRHFSERQPSSRAFQKALDSWVGKVNLRLGG